MGEILILVPRRSFAHQYVEELDARGVPAVNLAEPEQVLADCESRRVMYAIRYAGNPEDPIAVRGWLRCTSGIGPAAVATVIDHCLSTHTSFAEGCAAVGSAAIKSSLEALEDLVTRVGEKDSFEQVLEELTATEAISSASTERLRVLAEGLHVEDKPPDAAVEKLEAQDQAPATLPEAAPSVIRVTTFRKAKGLTAEVVIVTDLDDDIVPGNADDLSEERRLVYVSMTRARHFLYMLHVNYRYFHSTGYAGSGAQAPGPYRQRSRYLGEAGVSSEVFSGSA